MKDNAVKVSPVLKQVTINGENFRNALSTKGGSSWLTPGVLTTALSEFSGDLSDAQLKAIGFNKSQIASIQTQAQIALDAATKIKTLSQLSTAVKNDVATAWAAVFKRSLETWSMRLHYFSKTFKVVSTVLTEPLYELNEILEEWAALGGRTDVIKAFKEAFADLSAVLKPLKGAFDEIFPSSSADVLVKLSADLKNFFAKPQNRSKYFS